MKLKKIAALALAGVMAVSMLAGCAGKGTDDKKDPTDTSGVTAAAVIGALDESVTKMVKFSESTALGSTVDKMVQYLGVDAAKGLTATTAATQMVKFDKNLSSTYYFNNTKAKTAKEDDVKKEASITYVAVLADVNKNYADTAVVKQLADLVKTASVQDPSLTLPNLNKTSKNYTDSETSKDYYYAFSYTGNMSVTKLTELNGTVNYVLAFTVTRTPAKTAVVER